jgi:AcrR family transcriptional regulator
MCNHLRMARKYELKKRAESQEETRRRIVEAAIELHRTRGPARTTLSDVARLAGVQRHTLYRHFADERALGFACSGAYADANPPPDPEPWLLIRDPQERLRAGLAEIYDFFARNEQMLGSILRDAEVDPITRELFQLRFAAIERIHAVLAEGIRGRKRLAALDLALDFHTWRRLVRQSDLPQREAVELMVQAVFCRADHRRQP